MSSVPIVSPMRLLSIFDTMAKSVFVVLATVLMLAGCGGSKSNPVTLTSITVTPSSASIAPGTATQFRASGSYSDGSFQDLTTSVVWSSSNPAVASISNADGSKGAAAAIAAGSITISNFGDCIRYNHFNIGSAGLHYGNSR